MSRNMTGWFRGIIFLVVTAAAMFGEGYGFAQATAVGSAPEFAPLERWKAAVLAGDAAALKAFYSTDSVPKVQANGVVTSADADVNFWLGLKTRSNELQTV